MKKYFLSLLSIMLVPTLSACQDKANSIITIKTIDDSFTYIELKYEQLCNLIDSKQEFILETYSPTCSHCAELGPLLDKYSQSKDALYYRINMYDLYMDEEKNVELMNKYPAIFKEDYVPTVKYIKDANLTYQVNENKFSSYTALSKIMDKHVLASNITMINSLYSLREYETKTNTYVACIYDLENKGSLDIVKSSIINKSVAESKKPIVLLNKASFAGSFDDLKDFYMATNDTFAAYVQNGSTIKTTAYLNDDGLELNSYISSL